MDRRTGIKTIWAALFLAGLLVTPARAETVTCLHTDLLGSVVLETDQNRNVVARYEYEPYGLPRQAIADAPGYTGHVHDAGSGLVYMQQRYYDPEVGRFLSVDPVGVELATGANFNRYWYGNDNPYRYVDPDGRVPVLVAAAVFAWRAYSAYDTVTSAAENISTLADADVSLSDKALAGLELVASALGGKFGRESTENVVRATKGADASTNAVKLEKQLTSEEQLGQLATGGGTTISNPAKQADRIAAETGRDASKIEKVSSDSRIARDGQHIETHAYRDSTNNELIQPKTIIAPKEKQ